jgi:hypothetical protein
MYLKPAMHNYAEDHLYGETEIGNRFVRAFVNDFDMEFESLVRSRGHELTERYTRPMSAFVIPNPFPSVEPPEGFHIKRLADDNDLMKIHRVLWRGFDHAGEPPADEIEGRKKIQSTPNFRKDLTIVVEAPSGGFRLV